MKKLLIGALTFGFSMCAMAAEKEFILCTQEKDGSEVIIKVNSFEYENQPIHCISGDFVVDVAGCTPSGGFGLSPGVGQPVLSGVVDRWQDYMNHVGGVTSGGVGDTSISFSAGFNSPDSGFKDMWSFELNRLTGKAKLKESNKIEKTYTCKKVTPVV